MSDLAIRVPVRESTGTTPHDVAAITVLDGRVYYVACADVAKALDVEVRRDKALRAAMDRARPLGRTE
jgi:hypothetical protein